MLNITLAFVGPILAGTTLSIFASVVSNGAGIIAGVVTLVIILLVWLLMAFGVRPEDRRDDHLHGDRV